MENVKRIFKPFASVCLVLLLLICSFLFSACGGDVLSEEATYNKNINYSQDSSTSETDPVVTSIMGKVSLSGSDITEFNVLSAYRFTTTIKDENNNVTQYANMAVKNGEVVAYVKSDKIVKSEQYFYVKENVLYSNLINSGENAVKTKITLNTKLLSNLLSDCGVQTMFNSYIKLLIDNPDYTIKKSGTNFQFTHESTNLTSNIILQVDAENNVNSIYVYSQSLTGSVEMTLCAFNGNLTFPDLSGYVDLSI